MTSPDDRIAPAPASSEVEQALRQSEERFRLLVQSVRDYAILMLDADGRVTSWNEGAERIKGWTAEEIVGRSFVIFYPQEAIDAGYPQYELTVATREGRFEDEGWRVRKDGSRFWANVIITALFEGERLLGFAKITRDLTARREAQIQAQRLAAQQAANAEAARHLETLERLNAALERALTDAEMARDEAQQSEAAMREAYAELDQFAYVASHDLKAPLRGIANLAQWIQDDAGDALAPGSLQHLQLLQGRVHRMEALIDGILTYSRAGRIGAVSLPVDTEALVRETIELLAPAAEITIDVQARMPTIETERVPLQQVFINLLGNALKFSGAKGDDARIRVEWCDTETMIEFAVIDNGPGIAPEYHERVWGIFQTLASRDLIEGTGIGLAVVKKIVEKRGGRISLESAPGEGATFRFTWPK